MFKRTDNTIHRISVRNDTAMARERSGKRGKDNTEDVCCMDESPWLGRNKAEQLRSFKMYDHGNTGGRKIFHD